MYINMVLKKKLLEKKNLYWKNCYVFVYVVQ